MVAPSMGGIVRPNGERKDVEKGKEKKSGWNSVLVQDRQFAKEKVERAEPRIKRKRNQVREYRHLWRRAK